MKCFFFFFFFALHNLLYLCIKLWVNLFCLLIYSICGEFGVLFKVDGIECKSGGAFVERSGIGIEHLREQMP